MKSALVWLSDPGNIALLGTAIAGVLSLVVNVLQKLKLLRAATVIGDLKEDVREGTATVVALVQGVEQAKKTVGAVDAKAIARILQDHALEAGVEPALAPIVTEVQAATPAPVIVERVTGRLSRDRA